MSAALRVSAGLVAFATLAWPARAAVVLDFPTFSNCAALQLNGNAICTDGALRVTPAKLSQAGSAFSRAPVLLGTGNAFSTAFAFRMTAPFGNEADGAGADGITFTIQPHGNTAAGGGGGIGYAGIAKSIAIEFDTWNNGAGAGDPDGNHVGVNLHGSTFSAATAPVRTRLNDGNVWYAWIDYNGTALELRLAQTNTRPAAPLLSHQLNLVTVLGATQVYVGFTSATGAAYENHEILSWVFDNGFNPVGSAASAPQTTFPTLAIVALAVGALVLAAVGARAYRKRG